jgi:uncharacterized membrane protein
MEAVSEERRRWVWALSASGCSVMVIARQEPLVQVLSMVMVMVMVMGDRVAEW